MERSSLHWSANSTKSMRARTFDDAYGRHALVLLPGGDGPAFGRVDVIQLGLVGDAVFVPVDYSPRHAK